jgi:pilus assembly protein Flp/PilA
MKMGKALSVFDRLTTVVTEFTKDEEGATLVEYTVLLGILLIAVIALIAYIGGWISGQWSALSTTI